MTAITLNLLAAEQVAQQQQARDPLKLAIAIGVGLIAIVATIGGIATALAAQKNGAVAALQEQFNKFNSPHLLEQEALYNSLSQTAKDLLGANHSRCQYAPRLALIKDLIPDNVQLNRLAFSVATETVEAAGSSAEPAKGDAPPRAARPKVVERLSLRLDGNATSNRPELDVDVFLRSLRENPAFSGEIEEIQLRSIARGPGDSQAGVAALPSSYFVIECLFKERK
jgi:hypothetical protein